MLHQTQWTLVAVCLAMLVALLAESVARPPAATTLVVRDLSSTGALHLALWIVL